MNINISSIRKHFFYTFLVFMLSIFFMNTTKSQCLFDISITQTNNDCNSLNNAEVQVIVTGSNDVKFLWKNSLGTVISNSDTIQNLTSGVYIVFATDTILNCTQYKTVLIESYFETDIIITNPTCPTCTGIAELFHLGGQTPYTYIWDDIYAQSTRKASDLQPSFYSVILTDSNNCSISIIDEVLDCGKNIEADFIINPASCTTCDDATILANISGALAPYDYQWDDNLLQTTAQASNLSIHQNYSLIVTDSLGCQNTFFIDSTDFCKASISSNYVAFEPSCYDCSDGGINLSPTGAHSPFTVFWDFNGSIDTLITNLQPNLYSVRITDTIGCTIRDTINLQYCFGTLDLNSNSISSTNNYIINDSVSGNDIIDTLMKVAYVVAEKAHKGFVDMSISGNFSYTPFNGFSGIDSFTYQVFSDCGLSDEVKVVLSISNNDMVWPGDVDNNGIVDNFDLLPLAVYYDSIGAFRLNASNNYIGQFASDWASNQINGVNIKHADCNGSGKIDTSDITVIKDNYGVVHSGNNISQTGIIPLKLVFPDSINVGDTVILKIMLGDTSIIAQDVYGLAYTFNFDKDKINNNFVEVRFNDSWFTPDTNRLSFSKQFLEKGRIDIVQSRKNGFNASGEGEIGSIIIVIEEDIEEDEIEQTGHLDMIKLIQNDETELFVNKKTIVDSSIISSIKTLPSNDFEYSLSPNPSNGSIYLEFNKKGSYEIELINTLGQIIYQSSIQNKSNIEIEFLSRKGLYILKVKDNNLESTQKLLLY